MTMEDFIDDCRFAKVVQTKNGAAILVSGMVLDVDAPPFAGPIVVDWLVSALRRVDPGAIGEGGSFQSATERETA